MYLEVCMGFTYSYQKWFKTKYSSTFQERAEWINSIIHQLWPNIGHFTKKILSERVEPKLQAKFESMGISGFKFEKVDLGSIPPRISGIKVYDKNVSSSEIVLDLDLVLASDCDINFSLKNVTILQITNFSLRGLLRVVLKPLLTDKPLIGGFQYCFLSSPEIDYDLGGVANVVNMIPGLIFNFHSIFFLISFLFTKVPIL